MEIPHQEWDELCAKVQRLERENLEFRQQVGYWKSRHRDALLRVAELEQTIEQQTKPSQRPHFNHDQEEEQVPPPPTPGRIVLR